MLRLTEPIKSLPTLVSVITPAPALKITVPAEEAWVIAPLCVMPTAVTVKEPLPKVDVPKSIELVFVIATLLAPELFKLTEPLKLLPALARVITPAPALNEEVPALVIAPLCVIPTAVTVKEPLPKVDVPKSIAFESMMATLFVPELFKLTEPVKSLDWVRVITPVPALKVAVPAPDA